MIIIIIIININNNNNKNNNNNDNNINNNNNNNNNNKAVAAPHAGDWLNAPPITAIDLCLSDEAIRVAVGFRLDCITCQPHICICGTMVDARGLHGLSCRKSELRLTRHSQLNDIISRAVKRAQI